MISYHQSRFFVISGQIVNHVCAFRFLLFELDRQTQTFVPHCSVFIGIDHSSETDEAIIFMCIHVTSASSKEQSPVVRVVKAESVKLSL